MKDSEAGKFDDMTCLFLVPKAPDINIGEIMHVRLCEHCRLVTFKLMYLTRCCCATRRYHLVLEPPCPPALVWTILATRMFQLSMVRATVAWWISHRRYCFTFVRIYYTCLNLIRCFSLDSIFSGLAWFSCSRSGRASSHAPHDWSGITHLPSSNRFAFAREP